jgi:hypothetical protein
MFCPKCGVQNADDARFCRGCGANLSNVLAVVEGKISDHLPQSKEDNELFSSGIRNLVLGFGFIFISILLLFNLPGNTFYWLLMIIPGISLLASGISRLVKADGEKANINYQAAGRDSFPTSQSNAALPPVQTEYIEPEKSNYRTDDLVKEPYSITEPTTQHLKFEDEDDTLSEKVEI